MKDYLIGIVVLVLCLSVAIFLAVSGNSFRDKCIDGKVYTRIGDAWIQSTVFTKGCKTLKEVEDE